MSFIIIGIILLAFALLLISISIVLKGDVKKLKIKHKIQAGKITYSDLITPSRPLYSKRYGISGKPDYIVKKDGVYFPVEIKTGNHIEPKKNHKFQLAAYCQILEDNYKSFIPYGVLIYSDTSQQFNVPFNPKIRYELESIINEMRKNLKTGKIKRNHNNSQRCKNCSMRDYCNKKIN
jgi:CRISPR-associated exonuclease Cas4